MRACLHLLLRLLFGFRAENVAVLKTPGPVLLIPNHVSWIDWLFLYVWLDKDWKFVVSSVAAQYSWVHRLVMLNRRTFPVDIASPYAVKRIAAHLEQGGRLVLYAEGQLSRTGSLMKLYDGTGFLLAKTRARVITAYLRGASRLRWSRQPGWRRWFPRITLHLSPAREAPRWDHLTATETRTRLTAWLRDQMVEQQLETETRLGPPDLFAAILDAARIQPRKVVVQDATMRELTYRRLLTGAALLAHQLRPLLADGPARVGVLLPNVNATPVLLAALWAEGRVPAVLNYSTGTPTLLACAKLAGLKHLITSRAFLDRLKLDRAAFAAAGLTTICLEDVRARVRLPRKLGALLRVWLAPGSLRRRPAAAPAARAEAPAVVLFTSGSEGVPKGVELTHRNLLANIRQMLAITDIEDRDRIFNALPLFHSFGLTVGLVLGLVRGLYVFLYPSPLHYRLVPAVLYDRYCTIFFGTNTFLNGYARRAHPYDFRSMRYLFAGAEKLQESTAKLWSERFGVRILEGYGATECSPVISANVPMAARAGSAGRLLPGMQHRLEPVEGVADGGRLLVRGPNIMRGYLNREANQAFQALGGWYDTGDIVRVDEAGYLFVVGRLKRFAKISGEMVSLTALEDALAGAFPQFGLRCQVAVLAQPDADKGEALVAVTNEPKLALDALRLVLKGKGFTNLCLPREVRYCREIPRLGTGKINHRALAQWLGEAGTASASSVG